MKTLAIAIIAIATLTMILPISAMSNAVKAQANPILGGVANMETVNDGNHTVITITKNGTVAPGPIIVIPPTENNGTGNGTIIIPGENQSQGNVTVVEPAGNVTEVPHGNVTVVNNDTVVVTTDNSTVTPVPGNVTVITPPEPKPCACANQTTQPATQPASTIPPVQVIPAPGQNVTINQAPIEKQNQNQTTPVPFPPQPANETNPTNNQTNLPPQPPVTNQNQTSPPLVPANNQNQTQNQTGQTGNATNNTQTVSASPFLPGFKISPISYNGVNNQWLSK